MRVLIFHHPFPLPMGSSANAVWTRVLALFANFVGTADFPIEVSVCLPERRKDAFLSKLDQAGAANLTLSIHGMPEETIVGAIRAAGKNLRDIDREFYAALPEPLLKLVDRTIPDPVRRLKPDVVLGFGYPVSWLKPLFPGALVLNSETSSFSRYPFTPSFYFDHAGMFAKSSLRQVMSSIRNREWTPAAATLSETYNVRARSLGWSQAAGTAAFGLRHEPRRPQILLALQASGYSSFDSIVRYGNQFEYLFDVVSQVPTDVGVIATEHPTAPASARFLTQEEKTELGSIFPNLKFLQSGPGSYDQTSQMVLPFVDAIWTVSSNLAQLAAFWGRLVGTPAQSPYAFLSDSSDIASLCDNVLRRAKRSNPDDPAYFAWQFRHYVVPTEYLQKPGWFAAYLKKRIAGAAEPAIRAFPETGEPRFADAVLQIGSGELAN